MSCGEELPPLLLSKEEKTVFAMAAVAALVALTALGLSLWWLYSALPRPGQPVDSERLVFALALFSAVFFAIVYAIFGRWPGSVTSQARIELRASPEAVWDALALRGDYPGWKKIYTGIERLNEPGEVYRIHYAEDSECLRCLLPKDPDRPLWSARVEIVDARPPSLYLQRVFPKKLSAKDETEQLLDAEDFATLLEPLAGGGTRVTVGSTVFRPKLWFAVLNLLGRPVREELRSLRAHVDGTRDETLFGIAAKRMDLARTAPRHCRCGKPQG